MASTSILEDVKLAVGVVPEYDVFDRQLIVLINSVFATLHQLGCGPDEGFMVTGDTEKWTDFFSTKRLNFIQNYVSCKVRVMFAPPTSSAALDVLQKEIEQMEWRICSEVECYGKEDT